MNWHVNIPFGDPRLPLSFWRERYEDHNGCWLRSDGRITISQIYRMVYELLVGDIPHGYVLDHLCLHTQMCSNPDHMEPVTGTQNSLRNAHYSACGLVKSGLPRRVCARVYLSAWQQKELNAFASSKGMTLGRWIKQLAQDALPEIEEGRQSA